MINQDKIHNQCLSRDPKECLEALEQLKSNFSLMPDKQKAWDDLIKLATDRYSPIKLEATSILSYVFFRVPDKQRAWNDLLKLTLDDEYSKVRNKAFSALVSSYSKVPDKEQAWEDLLKLIGDQNLEVEYGTIEVLNYMCSQILDINQVWHQIHELTSNNNEYVRSASVDIISSYFVHIQDKGQAFLDLHILTSDKSYRVRYAVSKALISKFCYLPNKEQAWQDIIQLAHDEDSGIRTSMVYSFKSVIKYVDDKNDAWRDLLFLIKDHISIIQDEDGYAIWNPHDHLKSVFTQIPDKIQAWDDLLLLVKDVFPLRVDGYPLSYTFITILNEFPDKSFACKRLIDELNSKDCRLNKPQLRGIINELSPHIESVSTDIENKDKLWRNLLCLTKKSFCGDINHVSKLITSVFSLLSNKDQSLIYLISILKENENLFSLVIVLIFRECENKALVWKYIVQAATYNELLLSKDQFNEVFIQTADQSSAFMDIIQLSNHNSVKVRSWTAKVIGSLFNKLSDRNKACNILLQLAQDSDPHVRDCAVREIIAIFNFVEDKDQMWNKIVKILRVNNKSIQKSLLNVCKSIISKVPNKIQARKDLFQLASQGDDDIRLASVQIFGSSFKQLNSKRDLEDAIKTINDLGAEYGIDEPTVHCFNEILHGIMYRLEELNHIGIDIKNNTECIKVAAQENENVQREILEEIKEIDNRIVKVLFYVKPGLHEDLILHIGPMTPYGGAEYILTIPLQELSSTEIKEELKEIASKRISQLSMLPKKTAKIVEEYLVKNKMEDLLNKLR